MERGGFRYDTAPIPQPGPGEALIRVLVCGVCSSDMGAWRRGIGQESIFGHEVVGIVEELGEGVTQVQAGDRVTGCIMQGYREYTVASADALIPVPEVLSDREAIVEPYVCLISGIRHLAPPVGMPAAVVGAGYMGLGLIQLLKLYGAGPVTAVDAVPGALETARQFGADTALMPEEAEGMQFPVVFEAAGTQSALDLSYQLCAQYGTMVAVGYHPCRREVDMGHWASGAFATIAAFEYRRPNQLEYMREALGAAAAGTLHTGQTMTHEFSFGQLEEAFRYHSEKLDGYIKGCVRLSER